VALFTAKVRWRPDADGHIHPRHILIGILVAFMERVKSAKKRTSAPQNIGEYIAGVPEPARSNLKKMRAAIRSALPPEAVETISYRIPAFKYKKVLVWFAAFSDHCSLFPTAAVIEAFRNELKGFSISKRDHPISRGQAVTDSAYAERE
jgi:uncharacterized protein YdhG (YjbR/CyaY superfamily)